MHGKQLRDFACLHRGFKWLNNVLDGQRNHELVDASCLLVGKKLFYCSHMNMHATAPK